jgi:hypothetical protein
MIMFYLWAKRIITQTGTPYIWPIMNMLLALFSSFVVQAHLEEVKDFFWHDETTHEAQNHIQQY